MDLVWFNCWQDKAYGDSYGSALVCVSSAEKVKDVIAYYLSMSPEWWQVKYSDPQVYDVYEMDQMAMLECIMISRGYEKDVVDKMLDDIYLLSMRCCADHVILFNTRQSYLD